MILRGDFHFFRKQVLNRMIRPMVPEFQLERFSAKRQPAKLVAETNPKDGSLPEQLADILDRVFDRLRISRASFSISFKRRAWIGRLSR